MLAGGQSLIPAMRFRLARPAVLVDINSLDDLRYIRIDEGMAIGAIARDADIERAPWITERRWSLIHDASRVVADPVVRQMGTVVGSLCHNDPAGDWTAVALAARAEVVVRGAAGNRQVKIDDFLVDSFTTATGEGEMALAAEFPVPDDRTAGSYQKVERKVGDFATAAAAVQIALNADGTIRSAGVALSAAGPVRRARGRSRASARRPETDRGADWRRCRRRLANADAPQADLRGTSNTRSIWPACLSRAVCVRRCRVWGSRHEGQRQGQWRQLRAGGRAAHAARLLPARRLRADRHACRMRHVELRLLRRRHGRRPGGEVLHDVRGAGRRPRDCSPSKGSPQGGTLHALQQGFWDQHGLQCGYCTPGMLLTSYVLLKHNADAQRSRHSRGARRQSVPVHRLPEHREGGAAGGRLLQARRRGHE